MGKNLFDVQGKTVLITGASRGIGRAFAETFADQGANVIGTGSRPESVEWMNGTGIKGVAADMKQPGIWDDIISDIRKEHGRLDCLINNAGVAGNTPAVGIKEDEMANIIDVNFKGVFRTCQAYYKAQRKDGGGNIINVASVLGIVGFPLSSVYSGTKGAVVQLTRSLAVEWVGAKFRVNAILPGFINTDMTQMIRERKSVMEKYEATIPLGRMADTSELTGAAVFLASDASSYMTGSMMIVDGGITAM